MVLVFVRFGSPVFLCRFFFSRVVMMMMMMMMMIPRAERERERERERALSSTLSKARDNKRAFFLPFFFVSFFLCLSSACSI